MTSKTFHIKHYFTIIAAALLILVFTYAASDKLFHFDVTKMEMNAQPIPKQLSTILSWLVPVLELLCSVLLAFAITRLFGFMLASFLSFMFLLYSILVIQQFFDRVPCPCGGIIRHMEWKEHVAFTGILFLLSLSGWALLQKDSIDEYSRRSLNMEQ